MQGTPSTWRLLVEAGWEGAQNFKILCGGELLSQELAERYSRAERSGTSTVPLKRRFGRQYRKIESGEDPFLSAGR